MPRFRLDNCGAIFDNMEVCERNSCVRSYHIWDRACENRPCERKKSPIFSVFAVS